MTIVCEKLKILHIYSAFYARINIKSIPANSKTCLLVDFFSLVWFENHDF